MLNPSDRLSVHPAMYAKPPPRSYTTEQHPAHRAECRLQTEQTPSTEGARRQPWQPNKPPKPIISPHSHGDARFVTTGALMIRSLQCLSRLFLGSISAKKKKEGGWRGPSECLASRLNFSRPLPNICQIYAATTRLPPDFCERQTYPRTRVLLRATQILFESNTEDYRWQILSRTSPGYLEKQSHTLRVKQRACSWHDIQDQKRPQRATVQPKHPCCCRWFRVQTQQIHADVPDHWAANRVGVCGYTLLFFHGFMVLSSDYMFPCCYYYFLGIK